MPEPAKPTFFKSQADFHKWLEKNHDRKAELLVGFYKVDSGKKSITYKGALDEALCFGWIDGIRKSVDDLSYTIRFTPRKRTSIWSEVNIKRADELIKEGSMKQPGLEAFNLRDEKKSKQYSYEQRNRGFDAAHEQQFRANQKAWDFFQQQPPYYRKTAAWYVNSAKKEETRQKRLAILIDYSAHEKRLPQLTPPVKLT